MSSIRKKRIGIMGGTFDPVHTGHLILGEAAREQFSLDEVWFVPAGNPPHKREREGRATDEQRINMLRLAISSNPHFSMSLIDMTADGYSYTYRMLEYLNKTYPDTDWYFIMGADSLRDFDTWCQPERIVKACHVVVAVRDNMNNEDFDKLLDDRRLQYRHNFLKLNTPNLDISSHQLREKIRAGESIRYYLPDNVLYYIRKEGLYLIPEKT